MLLLGVLWITYRVRNSNNRVDVKELAKSWGARMPQEIRDYQQVVVALKSKSSVLANLSGKSQNMMDTVPTPKLSGTQTRFIAGAIRSMFVSRKVDLLTRFA